MQQQTLPIIVQAKRRFFYSTVAITIIMYFIIFLYELKSDISSYKQANRAIICVALLVCTGLFRLGYETPVRWLVLSAVYLHGWFGLLYKTDFFVPPIIISCVSLVYFPSNFLFDSPRQVLVSWIMVVGNFVLLLVFHFIFPVTETLVIPARAVMNKITIEIVEITLTILMNTSFISVNRTVYEEAQRSSDSIARTTKEKELFFATISHEIRNPLQSLLYSLELLQDRSTSRETFAALLEICKNCGEVMLNLVSNLLDMSKIAAAKMQLCTAPADLHEIVSKVIRISQARAQCKGVSIGLRDDRALPAFLDLDAQRVSQVILNILSNAIKFTNHGKIVVRMRWLPVPENQQTEPSLAQSLARRRVAECLRCSSWKEIMVMDENDNVDDEMGEQTGLLCRKYSGLYEASRKRLLSEMQLPYRRSGTRGEQPSRSLPIQSNTNPSGNGGVTADVGSTVCVQGIVKLEIMDTGIGISKEGVAKLFRPYQQAVASISKNYGGTGLGLWISKNILQLMGGDIRVHSKEGKGSNFVLAFPAKICSSPRDAMTSGSGETKDPELFRGKTCLLVDDLPENTFVIREYLQKYGLNTVCCQTGGEAMDAYKENVRKVDVIVTNSHALAAPGHSLVAAVRKLESETGGRKVPIVIVTAENSVEEKNMWLGEYGASDYLIKPIKCQDLIASLVRAFATGQPESPSPMGTTGVPRRVLIVEDEPISGTILAKMVGLAGHVSRLARSVGEAVEIVATGEFDMVFLDSLLGDGTGLDFMKSVDWRKRNNGKVPVVISMSGNSLGEQKEMYQDIPEVRGFLQKPVKKSELIGLLSGY